MTPARIMIVEDERITAEYLREVLLQMGYEVTAVVSTSVDAIREADRRRPDLVMMDIRIKGDVDGIDTARAIRERFNIPVVYLTAHADLETLKRARLAEPLGYLVKPFQEPELQASIEMALHKHRIDRSAGEERQHLSATLAAMGEGIITVDAHLRVTLVNPAAEAWTGWKSSDAASRPVDEVFRIKGGNPLANGLSSGLLPLEPPTVLIARDGVERDIGGTISPIRDYEGSISGAVIVFGDPGNTVVRSEPPVVEDGAESSELIVHSPVMKQLMNFARRIAGSEVSTILILGESGTGKDLLAKYIHQQSTRNQHQFLAVNCAAIPETLLESELFGYERGAFTDARQQKRGILEAASNGTVFLDEIGEMPMVLQAKLLRVLEEHSFRRLGGLSDIRVNLRLVTATNRDLKEAIQLGRFRLDLYYRLNVIQLAIPPLRQRREDILPLANHFVKVYNQRFRRDIKGLNPQAAEMLEAHDWPGNVRELRNAIERALVLEDTPWIRPASLLLGDVPIGMDSGEKPKADVQGMSLEQAEKTLLLEALEKAGWNQTRAAKLLSITRDTLRYKMKKFDLREQPEP